MYVCLCNGYRDAEIREVVEETGVRCPQEVYLALGNGPCCGTCLDCAQEIIDSVQTTGDHQAPAVNDDSEQDSLLIAAE